MCADPRQRPSTTLRSDVQVLKAYAYDLPPGSVVYADKAYNDYEIEDLLAEAENVRLLPVRKKNSKRPLSASTQFLQSYYRKRMETAGSQLMGLFPKSLHAVRAAGFDLSLSKIESGSFRARLQFRLLLQSRRNPIRRNLGSIICCMRRISDRLRPPLLGILTGSSQNFAMLLSRATCTCWGSPRSPE